MGVLVVDERTLQLAGLGESRFYLGTKENCVGKMNNIGWYDGPDVTMGLHMCLTCIWQFFN